MSTPLPVNLGVEIDARRGRRHWNAENPRVGDVRCRKGARQSTRRWHAPSIDLVGASSTAKSDLRHPGTPVAMITSGSSGLDDRHGSLLARQGENGVALPAGGAYPPRRGDLPRPPHARGDRRLRRRHQPRAADVARRALLGQAGRRRLRQAHVAGLVRPTRWPPSRPRLWHSPRPWAWACTAAPSA